MSDRLAAYAATVLQLRRRETLPHHDSSGLPVY